MDVLTEVHTEDVIDGVRLCDFDAYDKHHKVFHFSRETKDGMLEGYFAIHSIARGPAVGGTRFYNYASHRDALTDALNLSQAMSYKCALADVPYGGGKAVIIKDATNGEKGDGFLSAYADALNALAGLFYTGEDVGLDERDIKRLEAHSRFIIGRPDYGGMPASWAALSVFHAMRKSCATVLGGGLTGKSVAIKGVGAVGSHLAELLIEEGCELTVADIDPQKVEMLLRQHPEITIKRADPESIHAAKADIYAPCAMGYEFTLATVKELQCKIVCGSANNQLAAKEAADALYLRGICYIPDYVANAGGLINVVDELSEDGYKSERVREKIERIEETVEELLEESAREKRPVCVIADELAKRRIKGSIIHAS